MDEEQLVPRGMLDEEMIARIAGHLKYGNFIETAVKASGISLETYKGWIKRGLAERKRLSAGEIPDWKERIYVRLIETVDKVLAEVESKDLQRIENAANNDWRAAAWKMKKRWAKRWGDTERHDVTSNGETIQPGATVTIVKLPDNGR